MKYDLLKKEDGVVVATIQLDSKEWSESVEKAYQKNKAKYNVQGFRKGHAPRNVIEKTYGQGVFMQDALDSPMQTILIRSWTTETPNGFSVTGSTGLNSSASLSVSSFPAGWTASAMPPGNWCWNPIPNGWNPYGGSVRIRELPLLHFSPRCLPPGCCMNAVSLRCGWGWRP